VNREVIMVFIYILFAAIIFYFVIRAAIRDGIIESRVKEDELSYNQKSDDLLQEIMGLESKISKELDAEGKKQAKLIYDNSLMVYYSDKEAKEKFKDLREKKEALVSIKKDI
jgi:hypothetical protein